MARFIRRDREGSHEKSPENVEEGKEREEREPASAGTAPPVDRFLPYSLRKGTDVAPAMPEEEPAQPSLAETTPDFGQVGQRVADVLSTAEQAAEQIRQEAAREAEGIQAEALADAARIRREADEAAGDSQRVRAEADAYDRDARGAADAYAEQRRREAEETATDITQRAEREAGGIVEAAERRAREIEDAARQRGEDLEKESHEAEERMRQLLTLAREVTDSLEGRLAPEAEREPLAGDRSLDDALKARSAGAAQS